MQPSYFDKANDFFTEIKSKVSIALEAQRLYFIDIDKYESICKEDEKLLT